MVKETLEKYIDGKLLEIQVEDQENMLMHIGNPESYLRDELIYLIFGKLIFSNQSYPKNS